MLHNFFNVIVSKILKHVIQQPRPNNKEYGMPSAHSMFWAGFSILLFIEKENLILNLIVIAFSICVFL